MALQDTATHTGPHHKDPNASDDDQDDDDEPLHAATDDPYGASVAIPPEAGPLHEPPEQNADVVASVETAAVASTPTSFKIYWEVHSSPNGVAYYHNPTTGESRWVLPSGPLDVLIPGKPHSASQPQEASMDHHDQVAEVGEQQPQSPSSSSSSSTSGSDAEAPKKQASARHSAQAKIEGFRQLLVEKGVARFDRFEKWLPRLLKDQRFTAIPASERRNLFIHEAKRVDDHRRETLHAARKQRASAFSALLATAQQRGMFKIAQSAQQLLDHIAGSNLGTDERWRLTSPSERQRLVTAAFEEDFKQREQVDAEACRQFRNLVKETVLHNFSRGSRTETPSWGDARRMLRTDARWQKLTCASTRQSIYREMAEEAMQQWLCTKRKQAEEEDELAERRKRSRRVEADSAFRALIAEQVRSPLDVSWEEVCVLLANCEHPPDMDEASRHAIFNEIQQEEKTKLLSVFKDTLRKAPDLGPNCNFEEARAAAIAALGCGSDARMRGVPLNELRCTWEDWRRGKLVEATEIFRSWLRQCAQLIEATADPEALHGHGPVFESLCERLSGDSRYKDLEPIANERRRVIAETLRKVAADRAASRSSQREIDM